MASTTHEMVVNVWAPLVRSVYTVFARWRYSYSGIVNSVFWYVVLHVRFNLYYSSSNLIFMFMHP